MASNGLRRPSRLYSDEEVAQIASGATARQDELRSREVGRMSETGRALRMGLTNLASTVPAVTGLARGLVGDEAGAEADAAEALAMQERASAEGPRVQNIEQIEDISDALAYARNLGVSQLPNVAIAAATGGIGAGVRGGLGVAAREGVARQMATRVAADTARRNATRQTTAKQLASLTERASRRMPPVDPARLARQGAAAGGAVAGSVLQAGQIAPEVLSEQGAPVEDRALKALVGSLATGSLEALPVAALFKRFGVGGKLTRDLNKSGVVSRIAAEAGKQATIEGATEVAQTLGERATHKWVNSNVELMSEEALSEYMNAFVGGAVAGGIFGGPAGLRPGESIQNVRARAKEKFKTFSTPAEPVEVVDDDPVLADIQRKVSEQTQALEDDDVFDTEVPDDLPPTNPWQFKLDEQTGRPLISPNSAPLKGMFDADGMKALTKRGIPKRDALALSLLEPAFAAELHTTKPEVVKSAVDYLMGAPLDEAGQKRADVFLRALPKEKRARVVTARTFAESLKSTGEEIEFTGAEAAPAESRLDENAAEFTQERDAATDAELNASGMLSTRDITRASKPLTAGASLEPGSVAHEVSGTRRQFNLRGLAGKLLATTGDTLGNNDTSRVINALTLAITQARAEGIAPILNTLQPGFTLGKTNVTPEILTQVKRALVRETPRAGPKPQNRTVSPLQGVIGQAKAELEPRSATQVGNFSPDARGPTSDAESDPSTQLAPMVAGSPRVAPKLDDRDPSGKNDPLLNARMKARLDTLKWANKILGRKLDPKADDRALVAAALKKATPAQADVLRAHMRKFKDAQAALDANTKRAAGAKLTEGQTIDAGDIDVDAQQAESDLGQAKALEERIKLQAQRTRAHPTQQNKDRLQQLIKTKAEYEARGQDRDNARAVLQVLGSDPKVRSRGGLGVDPALAAPVGTGKASKPARKTRAKKGAPDAIGKTIARNKRQAFEDEDVDTGATSSDEDGARDALQRMADALSAKLGVPNVKVVIGTTGNAAGQHSAGTIFINLKYTGARRIEAFLHEFGHHVHRTAFDNASPEIKRAIIADYKEWRRKHGRDKSARREHVRASKLPASFAAKIWAKLNPTSKRLSEMTAEERQYVLGFDEYIADQLARAMSTNPDTQSVVGKFFSAVVDTLRQLYATVVGANKAYAPAPSVEAWVQTLVATPPPPKAQLVTPLDYATMLHPEERGMLEALFSADDVEQQIRAQAGPALRLAIDNYATRLESLINAGVALWLDGKLRVNPKQRGVLRNAAQFIKQAFGIATNQDLARVVLRDFKQGKIQRDPTKYRVKRELRPVVRNVEEFYNRRVRPVYDRLMESIGVRLRETNVPALRQLIAKIDLMSGERGDESMSQALFRNRGRLMTRYMEVTDSLTNKQKIALRRAMQRATAPKDKALEPAWLLLTKLMADMHSYGRAAGIPMGKSDRYFPVMMDPENVAAREDELRALYTKYLPQIRKMLKKRKIAFKDNDDALDIMIKAAKSDARSLDGQNVLFSDGDISPGFKQRRPRLSAFIYEGKNADDIKLFQTFQEKRLDKIIVNYVDHLVKRSEFTRRFPITKDRSELDVLFDAAKQQGASEADLQLARDYVDASLGVYNKRVSPVLKSILGAIDGVLGTNLKDVDFNKYAAVQGAIATYQNLRLLGLASLSSLIDPIGAYVRTGSLKTSYLSFRAALGAMRKNSPSDLRKMAEMLGVVERGALTELLSYTYGTGIDSTGVASKVNAVLFKVNGLEYVTRFSRMMALAAGHQFLLSHAAGSSKHSERYLRELNIEAKDIIRDPANPNFVVINDATRQALYRFVDEAVVRPRPQQKPLWHNDPNFALVAQYKGYLYAFYNTVIKRAMVEIKHGNYAVAAPLALYIPVTMMAEAAREMVQFGPEGDDKREKWELEDHMGFALGRSGLLGPKIGSFADARVDLTYGSTFANSFVGPTAQQLGDFGETAVGSRRVLTTTVDALPGSAIFEDYLR